MLSRIVMAALAAGALAMPAVADDENDDGGKVRVTICHRVGSQLVNGYFPGHIMQVSQQGGAAHLGHGDIPIEARDREKFGSSKICLSDRAGKLYDKNGKPIHPPVEEELPG